MGATGRDAAPHCHACGRPVDLLWTTAVDVEYATTEEVFRFWLCRDCDCLSIDPLPDERLDEIYPPTYYSFASGGGGMERGGVVAGVKAALDARTFRRVVAAVGRPDVRILDVGGGTGDIAAGLVRASRGAARATVVDLDRASVEAARARGLDGFAGRFEDYEPDGRFDVIAMLNLVEHVADPVAVLRRARGLLAPGGVVWIQTPNFRSLDARLFRYRNWTGLHCPRHWTILSEDGLRTALSRAGLASIRFERTQAGSFWAGSMVGACRARRADPVASGLPRPLVRHPAFLPLAALAAAFDFATRRWRPTSQVLVLARPD